MEFNQYTGMLMSGWAGDFWTTVYHGVSDTVFQQQAANEVNQQWLQVLTTSEAIAYKLIERVAFNGGSYLPGTAVGTLVCCMCWLTLGCDKRCVAAASCQS